MNELEVFFPSPVPVRIAEDLLEIWPLRVRRIGDMLRALGPVQHLFSPDAGVDIDALLQSPQAVEIIRVGLTCDAGRVASMDASTRRRVLLMVIGVNAGLFFPDVPEGAEPGEHDLSDLFQRLIESGHRWSDILDYTFDQCRVFDDAGARQRRNDRHDALIVGRAALASPEIFRRALKEAGNG